MTLSRHPNAGAPGWQYWVDQLIRQAGSIFLLNFPRSAYLCNLHHRWSMQYFIALYVESVTGCTTWIWKKDLIRVGLLLSE